MGISVQSDYEWHGATTGERPEVAQKQACRIPDFRDSTEAWHRLLLGSNPTYNIDSTKARGLTIGA